MAIDPLSVTAFATVIYGLATFLLWWKTDRIGSSGTSSSVQNQTGESSMIFTPPSMMRGGYWEGYIYASPDSRGDAAKAGRMYEALVRFECQLRLNNFTKQADDLGLVVRADIHGVRTPLAEAGVALGLLPSEYRRVPIAGVQPPTAK
jgi:hypothetical protein